MLRPISTPLILGGFEPETIDLISGAFRDAGFIPMAAGTATGTQTPVDARPAARGRRDRRRAGQWRHRHGRDRHGDPHRRRPRLRVRPPLLQSRPGRVPDDARLRLHDPAEPADVLQDLVDGRDDRDHDAGPADGDRRHARQRTGARADDGHARARRRMAPRAPLSDTQTHLQVPRSSTIRCSRRSSPT